MSEKKSNFPTTQKVKEGASALKTGFDEYVYRPKARQRLAKARLMSAIQAQPLLDLKEMTCGQIEKIVGIGLRNDWQQDGFQDWMLNRHEYDEKLELLFSLALDGAEQILQNTDPKAQSARVQMIKIVAELANKMPARWQQSDPVKDTLNSLNQQEIEDLLGKHGLQLKITAKTEQETVDVTPENK